MTDQSTDLSRHVFEGRLRSLFETFEGRLKNLQGYKEEKLDLIARFPPSLYARAFSSSTIQYGRLFLSLQVEEKIPSLASLLLVPSPGVDSSVLASLHTFSLYHTALILIDPYPLLQPQEEILSIVEPKTPGAMNLENLPAALKSQIGPAASMWRSLDFQQASSTLDDLKDTFELWFASLLAAPKIDDPLDKAARLSKCQLYLDSLREREERARPSLEIMLNDPDLVDPFLKEFYLPHLAKER